MRSIVDIADAGRESFALDLSSAVVLVAAAAALAVGGRLAARTALGVLVAHAAGLAVAWFGLSSPGPALLLIDAALLAALVPIAVLSRPCWILFAAAFQMLAVGTRALLLFNPSWSGEPALQVWSWGLAAALAAGCVRRLAATEALARDRPPRLL